MKRFTLFFEESLDDYSSTNAIPLHESVLITEMQQEVIDYIDEHKDSLPFDNIFGDESRIVIPMAGEGEAGEILNTIKQVKDYYSYDFETNEVIRKIKLDPKYGGGEKEQRINLGKALNSLKINPEKKKKYLDWYARYKDSIKDQLKESEYAIVLSRAPVDVVRMSDHRNISSCHSKGGSYFKCAVQEAISGGAVAYLVHRDSLDGYANTPEFQDEDLFTDSDRGVRGMEPPIARLRVRRFSDRGDVEYAIPEKRVYGNSNIPGFYKTLVSFLKTKQDINPEDIKDDEQFYLQGGTYLDNYLHDLLNQYFGIEEKDKKFKQFDVEELHANEEADYSDYSRYDELYEELQGYARISQTLEHVSASYDMDGNYEEEPYYMMWGSVSFEYPDVEFLTDFVETDDEYEYDKMAEGYYDEEDDGFFWSTFIDNLPDGITSNGFVRIIFDNTKKEITFTSYGIDPSQQTYRDADEYLSFINYLKDEVDDKYDSIKDDILSALQASGAVHDPTIQSDDYSRLRELNSSNELEIWNNIEINGSSKYNYIVEVEFKIESPMKPLMDRSKERQDLSWNYTKELDSILKNSLQPSDLQSPFRALLKDLAPSKPKTNMKQMEFKKFYEAFTNEKSIFDEFFIVTVSVWSDYNTVIISPKIKSENWSNEFFEILDILDDGYPHFYNMFRLMTYEIILEYLNDTFPEDVSAFKPNNYTQLKKIYGKYLRPLRPMI